MTGTGPGRGEVLPLLGATALLMAASALQFSLVGVRGTDAFSDLVLGLVSSAYFLGYLVGAWLSGPWIVRVGHIRTFSALASLASVVILSQALLVQPLAWGLARAVSGLCIAGMVVSVESWLNAVCTNADRGRVLGLYMVVMLGAFSLGQVSLGLADPDGFSLFAAASILLSLALLPVLLGVRAAPEVHAVTPVSVRTLVRRVPVGAIGSFVGGLTWGVVAAMFVVVAVRIGVPANRATWFAASPMLGALAAQWPLGWLSDVVDRRLVIAGLSVLGAGSCAATAALADADRLVPLLALGAVVGASTIPLYSLAIAHTADLLEPSEVVPASVTLQVCSSAGSVVGPSLAAVSLAGLGAAGPFLLIAASSGAYAAFTLVRTFADAAPADTHHLVALGPRATAVGAAMVAEELGASDGAPPPSPSRSNRTGSPADRPA